LFITSVFAIIYGWSGLGREYSGLLFHKTVGRGRFFG
jgi:hypothetical protein